MNPTTQLVETIKRMLVQFRNSVIVRYTATNLDSEVDYGDLINMDTRVILLAIADAVDTQIGEDDDFAKDPQTGAPVGEAAYMAVARNEHRKRMRTFTAALRESAK